MHLAWKTHVHVERLFQDENTMNAEKMFVRKLNLILVHNLKQEWPHNWPNFIPEIVNSSTSGEVICEVCEPISIYDQPNTHDTFQHRTICTY